VDVEALSRHGEGYLEHPRVAVDAMGGDHAPEEVVRGAVDWARQHPDVDVILVGDESRITPFIDEALPGHVRIVHASESIGMDEAPAVAVRRKRDAAINVAMRLVRDGEADAVVTAGHTGAGVASAILHLKRLPGVDRPALAVQMITARKARARSGCRMPRPSCATATSTSSATWRVGTCPATPLTWSSATPRWATS
jgi:fatty acid/phospholipid biosynthesis enzyme